MKPNIIALDTTTKAKIFKNFLYDLLLLIKNAE